MLLDKSGMNILNPIFSMSHLMHIGSNWEELQSTVHAIVQGKLEWEQTSGPSQADLFEMLQHYQ